VAQLGARFHGMEEVVSSNLTRSTTQSQPKKDQDDEPRPIADCRQDRTQFVNFVQSLLTY
jgi:hypothetical protein